MNTIPWYEWVGYISSLLVAVSLSMRSIFKLRWYNLAGALVFTLYGLLIKSYPVALVNFYIAVMDGYHLYQIYRKREAFTFYSRPFNDPYVKDFFSFYNEDIQKVVPGILLKPKEGDFVLMMYRDLSAAGIIWGREKNKGELEIFLDYVIPDYRDFKVGKFLYGKGSGVFTEHGFEVLRTKGLTNMHQVYLNRMGFSHDGNDYSLAL